MPLLFPAVAGIRWPPVGMPIYTRLQITGILGLLRERLPNGIGRLMALVYHTRDSIKLRHQVLALLSGILMIMVLRGTKKQRQLVLLIA